MSLPYECQAVLAKIKVQTSLGLSGWFEVVYHDGDKWSSYDGSNTFEGGEQVVKWRYCEDCLN